MIGNKNILITGASGYIGRQLGQHLQKSDQCQVFGIDICPPTEDMGFEITTMDIRSASLSELMGQKGITHVVHLASIVAPGQDEALEYDIDVNGTANVIRACEANHIKHLTVTSSGAAYGYHADNPQWLTEDAPLRGNEAFSYSRHKKLVEQQLARFSSQQTTTKVLILRPCTVLGSTTNNNITRLFERRWLLGVGQSDSPFVFIWDRDVVNALAHGVIHGIFGQFNLAGDGKVTLEQLAILTNKPLNRIPAVLLKVALWIGKKLRLTTNSPEQVMFLQYRPVLCNHKLKSVFGYVPEKTSQQVFEYFWACRNLNHSNAEK